MANITRNGAVLKVIGTDVVNADRSLNKAALKAALFTDSCPYGNFTGKVDFIICYVHQGPGPGTYSMCDNLLRPRPLRGIIYLPDDLNNFSPSKLTNIGGSIGHEIGHYWLVPGAAKIGGVPLPTEQQIAHSLNQGWDFPPYPIIGRDNVHWSPFIDVGMSPMEGPPLSTPIKTPGIGIFGMFGHYDQVHGGDKVGPVFTLPGIGDVQTRNRFCDLERWLIGSYRPSCISLLFQSFLTFVPTWSFPLEFESGLYVRLTSGETWYLGFHRGPHEICAHEISSTNPTSIISVGSDPLDPYVRIGARVVQNATSLDLQVRLWAPQSNFFFRSRANPTWDEMMSDIAQGGTNSSDAWTGWKTLASTSGRVTQMGLSSRGLGKSYIYTLSSASLCLNQNGTTIPIFMSNLQQDFPAPGPAFLPSWPIPITGRLMMPYLLDDGTYVQFFETQASRTAPKLLQPVPSGDFAFGGTISLDRCVQIPRAGGLGADKNMVGHAKSIALYSFVPPWNLLDRMIRQSMPLNGAYKVLFCLAGNSDNMATNQMATSVDNYRRAWEIYSPLLMDRNSDTNVV